MTINVQEKLNLVKFRVDKQTHVNIDKEKCSQCKRRPCLHFCPAGLFTLSENELTHSYEGCLECGTCYVACERKAITWNYPGGGLGVCYYQT